MKSERTKRNLFKELSEGMVALAETGQGKRRIRTHVLYHYTECGLPNVWLRNGYVDPKLSGGAAF